MNNLIIEKKIFPTTNSEKQIYETLFHVANGYVGTRGSLEEIPIHPGTYINGVYEEIELEHAEPLFGLPKKKDTIVNICNLQGLNIYIDKIQIDFSKCQVLNFYQYLDMKKGVLSRNTTYKDINNNEITINTNRLASFTHPHLIHFSYSISINNDKELCVESFTTNNVSNYVKRDDPRANHKVLAPITPQNSTDTTLISEIKNSKIKILVKVHYITNLDKNIVHNENTITCTIKNKSSINFEKNVLISDSIRDFNIDYSKEIYFDDYKLKTEQENYLKNFWDISKITIGNDNHLEKGLNYNLFQLEQSKSIDCYGHLGAKGLSGEGYEGHYFWDTEMYCQPFFTLTNPEISKTLLQFRYNQMNQARENAKRMGHKKGVLFPWRTISGKECSGFFPAGTAQYHINCAIAYAIIMYYRVTEDKEFMLQYGMQMLIEICRLFIDLGNFYNDKFEIHEVTGPDEYTCLVSNNYYTNVSVKYDLENLLQISNSLNFEINEDELIIFKKAADKMYLPKSEKLKICLQDDSFIEKPIWDLKNTNKKEFPLLLSHHPLELYRYQVCKQPDVVLANALYPSYQTKEYIDNSYEYYKKITTHDSSLSPTIFSIAASRLNKKNEALDFFGNSALLDLENLKKNTEDGIHTANMGGCYLAIIFGFAGLKIKDNILSLNPILPDNWTHYSFNLIFKGVRISFDIKKDNLEIISNKDIKIEVNNKIRTIKGYSAK